MGEANNIYLFECYASKNPFDKDIEVYLDNT